MKQATKAALISGLGFPGAGHFYLARYAVGTILMLPALATIGYLLRYLIQKSIAITQLIINREIEPSFSVIQSLIYADQTEQISLAFVVFLIVWIVALVDSYRIGRAMDQKEFGG